MSNNLQFPPDSTNEPVLFRFTSKLLLIGRFACVSIYYETRHKNFIYYELNVTVFEEAMLWLAQFGGQRHHKKEGIQ